MAYLDFQNAFDKALHHKLGNDGQTHKRTANSLTIKQLRVVIDGSDLKLAAGY